MSDTTTIHAEGKLKPIYRMNIHQKIAQLYELGFRYDDTGHGYSHPNSMFVTSEGVEYAADGAWIALVNDLAKRI